MLLGLLQRKPSDFLHGAPDDNAWSPDRIENMISARAAAKKSKNFPEADRIRQELLSAGIVLEDTPKGTVWRRGQPAAP